MHAAQGSHGQPKHYLTYVDVYKSIKNELELAWLSVARFQLLLPTYRVVKKLPRVFPCRHSLKQSLPSALLFVKSMRLQVETTYTCLKLWGLNFGFAVWRIQSDGAKTRLAPNG